MWTNADAIVPLAYNFKFDRPDGLPPKPIVFRTFLYAFGKENAKALNRMAMKVR